MIFFLLVDEENLRQNESKGGWRNDRENVGVGFYFTNQKYD